MTTLPIRPTTLLHAIAARARPAIRHVVVLSNWPSCPMQHSVELDFPNDPSKLTIVSIPLDSRSLRAADRPTGNTAPGCRHTTRPHQSRYRRSPAPLNSIAPSRLHFFPPATSAMAHLPHAAVIAGRYRSRSAHFNRRHATAQHIPQVRLAHTRSPPLSAARQPPCSDAHRRPHQERTQRLPLGTSPRAPPHAFAEASQHSNTGREHRHEPLRVGLPTVASSAFNILLRVQEECIRRITALDSSAQSPTGHPRIRRQVSRGQLETHLSA
jgi:hypothetical protein